MEYPQKLFTLLRNNVDFGEDCLFVLKPSPTLPTVSYQDKELIERFSQLPYETQAHILSFTNDLNEVLTFESYIDRRTFAIFCQNKLSQHDIEVSLEDAPEKFLHLAMECCDKILDSQNSLFHEQQCEFVLLQQEIFCYWIYWLRDVLLILQFCLFLLILFLPSPLFYSLWYVIDHFLPSISFCFLIFPAIYYYYYTKLAVKFLSFSLFDKKMLLVLTFTVNVFIHFRDPEKLLPLTKLTPYFYT